MTRQSVEFYSLPAMALMSGPNVQNAEPAVIEAYILAMEKIWDAHRLPDQLGRVR